MYSTENIFCVTIANSYGLSCLVIFSLITASAIRWLQREYLLNSYNLSKLMTI